MLSHKHAAETQIILKGWENFDALNEFIQRLVDTIGWWESQDKRDYRIRQSKNSKIAELTEEMAGHMDETATLTLGVDILRRENLELKEERDQLVDENVELMTQLDSAHRTIGAINQVLGISR